MQRKEEILNFKEKHKTNCSTWKKQVLQNKPMAFRPTDKQWIFLKRLETIKDKSKVIREALDLYLGLMKDSTMFFLEQGRKRPESFKRANIRLNREIKENRIIYEK